MSAPTTKDLVANEKQLQKEAKKRDLKKRLKKYWMLYFMALPCVLGSFVFSYVPMWGLSIAFMDYKVGKPFGEQKWVGFKHFIKFFNDWDLFSKLLKNTVLINVCSMICVYVLGVTLAVLLFENRMKKLTRGTQLITLYPHFLSQVIVYSIATIFMAQNNGVINQVLRNLGIIEKGIPFMTSNISRWAKIAVGQWCGVGYQSIILYSSLVAINSDEFEAATIDGASRFQRIRYITLPHLLPTVCVMMVVSIGNLLSSNFESFKLWTNSGNYDTMISYGMYVYNYGMQKLRYSYATAIGIVNSVVSLFLVFFANKMSKKVSGAVLF